MWTFAWRNLATRPLRTALALIGLSIPILGVIGLFSLSGGMRNLVGQTLQKIQGVVVLREGQLSPVLSDMPAEVGDQIRSLPNIHAVAAEIWKLPPSVEGKTMSGKVVAKIGSQLLNRGGTNQTFSSLLDMPVLSGQEIASHQNLRGAIFPRHMLKGPEGGRFLRPGDENTNRVVISRKLTRDNRDRATGEPKKVGDSIDIGGEPFEIIGIYDTGSMLLDTVILMDIGTLRRVVKVPATTVSSFYVESSDISESTEALSERIEARVAGVDARGSSEILAGFGNLMNQLDLFLLATVMLALIVGVVGIINTMLMSTTERFAEFGVLRTNGWSRRNVLTLVTAESAYLGLLSGVAGFLLALLFTTVANQFITSTGLSLTISPQNALGGLALSIVMGTLGGLYPAWKASRLVPMDAIRLGAR